MKTKLYIAGILVIIMFIFLLDFLAIKADFNIHYSLNTESIKYYNIIDFAMLDEKIPEDKTNFNCIDTANPIILKLIEDLVLEGYDNESAYEKIITSNTGIYIKKDESDCIFNYFYKEHFESQKIEETPDPKEKEMLEKCVVNTDPRVLLLISRGVRNGSSKDDIVIDINDMGYKRPSAGEFDCIYAFYDNLYYGSDQLESKKDKPKIDLTGDNCVKYADPYILVVVFEGVKNDDSMGSIKSQIKSSGLGKLPDEQLECIYVFYKSFINKK